MDLANGFIEHVASKNWAIVLRNGLEMSAKGSGDDEFAAIHGLV